MKIIVNGKAAEVTDDITLASVIAERELDESKVLASVNKAIIKAGTFSEITLADGDEVELFSFVSGG